MGKTELYIEPQNPTVYLKNVTLLKEKTHPTNKIEFKEGCKLHQYISEILEQLQSFSGDVNSFGMQ